MAAVSPIRNPSRKPGGGSSLWLNIVKIAILVVLVGGSVWLLLEHMEWFRDPKQIKLEVLQAGVWAPIVYMLLYAVGPSFLVPGAVMTIAGGLAFGTAWGSVYSLIGADIGAVVAFGAGRSWGAHLSRNLSVTGFRPRSRKSRATGFRSFCICASSRLFRTTRST